MLDDPHGLAQGSPADAVAAQELALRTEHGADRPAGGDHVGLDAPGHLVAELSLLVTARGPWPRRGHIGQTHCCPTRLSMSLGPPTAWSS
jgi:hypothetical protein